MNKYGGVWFAQETWLSEKQIPTLQQLGTQFVACSGMEDTVSSGIHAGRPFGGVSIAWSPNLNHLIKPLSNFRHKRVVGIELLTCDRQLLLINVYMPYLNSSRRAECMTETTDVLSMVETIIEAHPQHEIIIGGDMNCEFKQRSPFEPLWTNLSNKFELTLCDSFLPPSSFTYFHESLDQRKWNDHFFVSKSLIQDDVFSNHQIMDDGDNPSDHLPISMSMSININSAVQQQDTDTSKESLKWEKIPPEVREQYSTRLQSLVNERPASPLLSNCQATCQCENTSCKNAIQEEYDSLMRCLTEADSILPRYKPGREKAWWTENLTEMRNKSINIHNVWKSQGRPHQGPIHDERIRVRAAYKRAIRAAQRAPKQASWDKLHSSLAEKDTTSFWRSWKGLYNKNKSHLAPVVNGCSSKQGIADSFKESFQKNCQPNNSEKVADLNSRFTDLYEKYKSTHISACNCNTTSLTLENTFDGLSAMKNGKCADDYGMTAEHFHFAPLNFLKRLTSLFNHMLMHAFVPKQFGLGSIIPLIKDTQGNHADLNNYRGITISPIASKLFEHMLKIAFSDYLFSTKYQFGFKRNNSTTHALFCFKQTVNYFVENGSRVFCCFLDASKAFDRVVHAGLFIKLINRMVPLPFLNIIISWYSELYCRVRWGDTYSEWFFISAGVRQGGVLSPDFYSIYIDELVHQLRASRKGCYMFHLFAAALCYADDVAILAPSIKGLTALLSICENYCIEWDICLNPKKTKLLYFGRRMETNFNLTLNGKVIEWVEEWTYLGVRLKSGKTFNCTVTDRVKKFYKCANAIFRIDGRSNDTVMLHLAETHCVPLLTYAIEVIVIANRDEKRQLRVAYNSVFRKIFGYRWSESVTALQGFLGRPTWEQLVERRTSAFLLRLSNHCLVNAFNM